VKRALGCVLALALAVPAASQTRGDIHAEEVARFDHGELRTGANGNDPLAPNYANFDEAKVGSLSVPPLLPEGVRWDEHRARAQRLVEQEWVGEIPEAASTLRIVWSASPEANGEHWLGQVIGVDGRMGPSVDGVLSLPPATGRAPVVIEYSYIWPPGLRLPGPPPPTLRDAALARGWAHFAYRPTLLQADDLGKLCEGVIGLVRCPREEHDWGALRAWGWGASRVRERLSAHPRIDGARIALAGHSRFGKAVLVAAAFDHGFADALVSSSGAGGAKLMRRDYGERLENMADAYASIWYAPRIRHYAGRAKVAHWPVDAHMLIALRAPRPLFIATGTTEKGDGWTDPRGQLLATEMARQVWGLGRTNLEFHQHAEGHVMWPAFGPFLYHADRFASGSR